MEMDIEKINKFSTKISETYSSELSRAKSSICIFLLGCYCKVHKPVLMRLRKQVVDKKVACLIAGDLNVKEIDDTELPDYSKKFELICNLILNSYRRPVPFIYIPITKAECGDGAKIELVTLCENPKYEKLKENIILFTEDIDTVPHQHKHLKNPHIGAKDEDDFLAKALGRVKTEINIMSDILTRDEENNHEQNRKAFKPENPEGW